jgi:peptidoglycan hydrolase-like protein with peptidoglycan-binding domain
MPSLYTPTLAVITASFMLAACGSSNTTTLPNDTAAPAATVALSRTSTPDPITSPIPAATSQATNQATTAPATPTTQATATAVANPNASPPVVVAELARVLSFQSPPLEGDDVRAAQQRLLDLGYTQVGEVDGIFGTNTAQAVRAFQTAQGLAVDGVIGPQTWEALFGSASGNRSLIPIIDADTNWLIGATEQGRWIDAPTAGPLIGTQQYQFLTTMGDSSTATGTIMRSDLRDICPNLFTVELQPQIDRQNTIGIGSGATHALQPQPIAQLDLTSADYDNAITDALNVVGLSNPTIGLVQGFQTDIDGDGTQEVVLTAEHRADGTDHVTPSAKAGDYSAVMIVKNGKATLVAYDIQTKDVEFGAPLEFRVVGVADLNGDSRMDLVVRSSYYEGTTIIIYDLLPEGSREAISTGCGV